ncbi:MAG: peptidoglycan-associated lipoprotein Pal [Rickettsiaceae bacterium]|nr:peptidoglycan-associated lipoprotein Pal [Rickettsiaceae bacterium]
MFKKVLVIFFAMTLLSACASKEVKQGKYDDHSAHIAQFESNEGDRVFFDFDSAALTEATKDKLTQQVRWLNIHRLFNSIVIEGHCDERGTREYNLALGARRAEAIKRYLIAEGLDADRIVETVSYGKERPAVIGNNEAAWSKNRRGVTSIRGMTSE